MSIKIERLFFNGDVVYYDISFFDIRTKENWLFRTRYDEIKALNKTLIELIWIKKVLIFFFLI